jgi:hypothetical protein
MPPVPGADLAAPVLHQGELLGAISVRMTKDEPLRPAGEQLVTDVASQAGLVLSNAGLIEDLRASGSGWSPRRTRPGGGWNGTSTTGPAGPGRAGD